MNQRCLPFLFPGSHTFPLESELQCLQGRRTPGRGEWSRGNGGINGCGSQALSSADVLLSTLMEGGFLERLYCMLCPLAQPQGCRMQVRGKSQPEGTRCGERGEAGLHLRRLRSQSAGGSSSLHCVKLHRGSSLLVKSSSCFLLSFWMGLEYLIKKGSFFFFLLDLER